MTDKEIIIDGIDVSKCGHYHYGKCEIDYDEWNNEIIRYNECQNNPNCYFKQLKRKEQECEELINQRDKFEYGNNILEHERNNYKQALDEIEEFIEVAKGEYRISEMEWNSIQDIINKAEAQ